MTLRTVAMALAATGLVSLPVLAQSADNGGRKLQTTLTGAAEVPGPGDTDATGTASVTVNPGQKKICYDLTVANIDPATMAHIHAGAAGVAGPVVVTLQAPTGGSSSGCVTVTQELALKILKSPADFYVNVHNAAFPSGAARGQLAK